MNLGSNIYNLRKKNGITQEQLADMVDVTRQTISNWESDKTYPNPAQLKLLAQSLNTCVDRLIDDNLTDNNTSFDNENPAYSDIRSNAKPDFTSSKRFRDGYEYKSSTSINGVPLIHINVGCRLDDLRKAKGIIAIGNAAVGILAIGNISLGIISIGCLGFGIISIGALIVGLLAALGAVAIGSFACGGIAIGLFAIGGVAVGFYSLGGCAIARNVACGDYASGYIAIGNKLNGTVKIDGSINNSDYVYAVIEEFFPNTPQIIKSIFSNCKFNDITNIKVS